jgi:rhamnulokinase
MANKYKEVFGLLESTTDKRIDEIQVVGGGSQNQLLNQLTANACGVPVVAGPVEATAIGNIMVQAEACGAVTSNEQYNQIIIDSFSLKRHLPT